MYALEMLADSYSPFAAPVDDASRSQATSGSAMTDGSDADARAVAVHQFTAQCAAPPTLRMFVSRRAEHRQVIHPLTIVSFRSLVHTLLFFFFFFFFCLVQNTKIKPGLLCSIV